MTKTMTILTAAVLTAATMQAATAGTRDNRKAQRAQPQQNQQLFDSNASYGAPGWRNDGYRYDSRLESLARGGAISAPAGR